MQAGDRNLRVQALGVGLVVLTLRATVVGIGLVLGRDGQRGRGDRQLHGICIKILDPFDVEVAFGIVIGALGEVDPEGIAARVREGDRGGTGIAELARVEELGLGSRCHRACVGLLGAVVDPRVGAADRHNPNRRLRDLQRAGLSNNVVVADTLWPSRLRRYCHAIYGGDHVLLRAEVGDRRVLGHRDRELVRVRRVGVGHPLDRETTLRQRLAIIFLVSVLGRDDDSHGLDLKRTVVSPHQVVADSVTAKLVLDLVGQLNAVDRRNLVQLRADVRDRAVRGHRGAKLMSV